jgi:hypothetical protein
VRDANGDNVAQTSEVGIGHAKIRAKVHPTLAVVATVESSVGDGAFSFPMLPEGVYDFEEVDPHGYMSTGDSAGANDNTVPNVIVSYALGNIVTCAVAPATNSSVACVDFFDVKIAHRSRGGGDDDDDGEPGAFAHCHNPLTWFLHSDCTMHVWTSHITTVFVSFALGVALLVCVTCCLMAFVFTTTTVRRPAASRPSDAAGDNEPELDFTKVKRRDASVPALATITPPLAARRSLLIE